MLTFEMLFEMSRICKIPPHLLLRAIARLQIAEESK